MNVVLRNDYEQAEIRTTAKSEETETTHGTVAMELAVAIGLVLVAIIVIDCFILHIYIRTIQVLWQYPL